MDPFFDGATFKPGRNWAMFEQRPLLPGSLAQDGALVMSLRIEERPQGVVVAKEYAVPVLDVKVHAREGLLETISTSGVGMVLG